MPASLILEALPPQALPLADRFYREQGEKDRCRSHDRVWLARSRGRIIGVARLSPQGGALQLRGVWVSPEHRRHGAGAALVRRMLAEAGEPVWCFALPGLIRWYLSFGFCLVDTLPEAQAAMLVAYRRGSPRLEALRYP
ncbi:GNAT family N-acetyltransferase [Ferrimonas sediminicola]|uniref:GNAT family N-acetyltransferase n=1 Tax=Ferrimonas sediminicola TaxID=2569538 RepID=A0A4U1BB22_9GAMM|nr:GNAT family N-acetyltransferase [Ferrimonas sediminicola]TKB47942.1 GNAT family N-acetyltransferase [Ferrimonas sediminicola]